MPGLVRNEFDDALENYDNLTIGEIMSLAAQSEAMRKKLLKAEEKGKNREEVVAILRVNWNS